MSTDAGAPESADRSDVDEYAEKRLAVEDTIAWIDAKLEDGRIRDPERARARQGYLRLKIKAIGEWRKLKEAGDLAELDERLSRLEAGGGRP